jgi:hypothetical protein
MRPWSRHEAIPRRTRAFWFSFQGTSPRRDIARHCRGWRWLVLPDWTSGSIGSSRHRGGGLRKLARPGLVLAFAVVPALCVAAGFDWHAAPNRLPLLFWFQGAQVGKLSAELGTSTSRQIEPLIAATAEQRATVPVTLTPKDQVFVGATFYRKQGDVKLALVEPAIGAAYLFADTDRKR